MASPPEARAALGLSLGDPGPSTTAAAHGAAISASVGSSPRKGLANLRPPPIMTQEPESSVVGYDDGTEPNPSGHMSIPPPPSPRRHRQGGIMSRVRAHSGGHSSSMSPSKSWADLTNHGFGMTSATPVGGRSPLRSPSDDNTPFAKRSVSDGAHLGAAQDGEDSDTGSYDNSARFYYRRQATSRQVSPTRSSVSASRSARSVSPGPAGVSPLPRRSLHLPSSGAHSPGASLSAKVSPNSRFLQQRLPPTFPHASGSQQPSPDLDPSVRLSPPVMPHAQVILTPTTQEWHELKEMSKLEGTPLVDDALSSDSDSIKAASVRSTDTQTRSTEKAPQDVDYFNVKSKMAEQGAPNVADPPQPSAPKPAPDAAAPVPLPPAAGSNGQQGSGDSMESNDSTSSQRVPELILQDNDDTPNEDSPVITVSSPRGFTSFGRRDSLRVKNRPASSPDVPKAKTKRELERERLFKMVDEQIAQSSPEDSPGFIAGRIQEIGRGGGLDSRGSASSLEPDRRLEMSPSPPTSPAASDSTSMARSVSMPGGEPLHPLLRRFSNVSSSTPVRPSPLHSTNVSGYFGSSAVATSAAEGELSAPAAPPVVTASPAPMVSPESAPTPAAAVAEAASQAQIVSPDSSPDEPVVPAAAPETENERFEAIRNYSRSFTTASRAASRVQSRRGSQEEVKVSEPRSPRRRDTSRISLVAGRVVQPLTFSAIAPLSAADKAAKALSLQSFSPFRTPSPGPTNKLVAAAVAADGPRGGEISAAPSTVAPSECGTPPSEKAAGIGGHGIDDYVVHAEAGKGAYGLVMRARVKGANGQPVGDEVIIKYIIKSRILADCWKKHKALGPIPVEIHVMDQVRHLMYNPPRTPNAWDPHREDTSKLQHDSNGNALLDPSESRSSTPRSDGSQGAPTPVATQKYISGEIRHAPERGHPNVCKLLDFFEDREFYYLVMPRYGTGVDLFDYVESHPDGLPPFEIRSLVGQLTDAIRFLHTNGIVHRDIKDENVILDGAGGCQLIDFGSAAHWRPGKRWDTFSGTLHYASPEILRGEMYGGKEQDVWALGTVAYVLLVGETPFTDLPDEVFTGLVPGSRAEEALDERCGGAHQMEGLEPDGGGALGDAADMVRCCLSHEVGDRPTAEQLLQHRYLAGMGGWTGRRGWERARERQ